MSVVDTYGDGSQRAARGEGMMHEIHTNTDGEDHHFHPPPIDTFEPPVGPYPRTTPARRTYIDNPLARFSPSELEEAVKTFAEATELSGITDLLIRGAKLAKNPSTFTSIPGLTDEERDVLKQDRTSSSFLKQTKELQVTMMTCAVAAVVQGWDQASINGANLRWPEDLSLAPGLDDGLAQDVWIFAFVNAAPYIFASLVGAWLSDPLNEYLFGRRAAIFVAAVFCLISVVGSACVETVGQMLACRILLGFGMGCKASVVPILAAEVAPARFRGSLVMNWQLFVAFGIFLGFSANLAVFEIRGLNWRLQLASAALPAIPLIILIFVCPESPRFLIKQQKWKQAYRSLCYLNKLPLLAAKELFLIHTQIQAESKIYADTSGAAKIFMDTEAADSANAESVTDNMDVYKNQNATSYLRRFIQLFTVPRIRRATTAAFVVMASQQLCGVNIMAFYSSTIVSGRVKYNEDVEVKYEAWRKALWMSWGIGLANFIFTWPAYRTIDRWGRRALLLLTVPLLALTLLAAAFCFKIEDPKAQLAAVSTFFIAFIAFYSMGLGPVPFTYSAEVFPLVNREVGMSFAVSSNLLGAGILSLFVPFLNARLTPTGLLCLFAGLNVVAFVLIYFFVYETKQAMLEELNAVFDVPTMAHIRYQWREMLPWTGRYFITRSTKDKTEPLHRWYYEQMEMSKRQ